MYALKAKNGYYVGVQAQELSTATHEGGKNILVENIKDGAMKFTSKEMAEQIKTTLTDFENLEVVPVE